MQIESGRQIGTPGQDQFANDKRIGLIPISREATSRSG